MSFSGLMTLEELNLQLGEYAVCMAKRNPFSSYYPMVIRKVKNGYICPALETYITDISGGFRIPDPTMGDAAGTNNNVRDGGASTAILGDGDDIWYLTPTMAKLNTASSKTCITRIPSSICSPFALTMVISIRSMAAGLGKHSSKQKKKLKTPCYKKGNNYAKQQNQISGRMLCRAGNVHYWNLPIHERSKKRCSQ